MSGGKLLVSNGMSGAQGTGARQAFVWTAGTLATYSYTATNLTSGTGIAVSATSNTLTNAGGTLAPGDIGTPGKTTITGNYAVTYTNAALAIDLSGSTAATAFQDSASTYDNVSVTGTASLAGTLNVTLINSFIPSSSGTFTILTSGTLFGSFNNVAFGSRLTTADGLGSYLVSRAGNSITLTNFIQTAPVPGVQSMSATSITGTSAILNGTVNANGVSTAVSFDYGTSMAYGTNVPGTPTPVTGTAATAVSATLGGLTPGAAYHFRADGVSASGSASGGDMTFVTLPAAPLISGTLSITGTDGNSLAWDIIASGGATSFNAAGLPPGLTLNPGTGLISGTPSASGTFAATIAASNAGGTAYATLDITLAPANVPAITSGLSATGTDGLAFSYLITATNNPASYNASNLPAGLGVNASNGMISGTPTATGTFSAAISAINASGTGSALLTLTVGVLPISQAELVAPQFAISGDDISLTVSRTVPGRTYQLQYSQTLQPGSWINLGQVQTGDGTGVTLSGTFNPAVPAQFYRLELGP
jgi:hypothetical protein